MEDFNLFEGLLEKAVKHGEHLYLLGKSGDLTTMYNDTHQWYGNKQRTNGHVLIYDESSGSLDWKSVYKNTKGLFFKKDGAHYLT